MWGKVVKVEGTPRWGRVVRVEGGQYGARG